MSWRYLAHNFLAVPEKATAVSLALAEIHTPPLVPCAPPFRTILAAHLEIEIRAESLRVSNACP